MKHRSDSAGQGLVEYALILIFVGMMIIVMVNLAGPGVGQMFSSLTAAI
ncbi:MAG: pilus assembly protein [Chloroflexi bacterium]|nr:pilus assembly protein [Chloroflexota bacterium]